MLRAAHCLLTISMLSAVIGCIGPGPDGKTVVVLNLAGSPCADVRQVGTISEATLKYAKELETSGKITQVKLVDFEERMFLLQSQSDSACNFFNRGRISFEQYRSEMERITKAMQDMKNELPRKEA